MRIFRRCFVAVCLAVLLGAPPANTQTPAPSPPAASTAVSPPSGGIKLPDLPSGMCAVDPNQDADRNVIPDLHLAAQSDYKLLAVFGECVNLKALRSGSSRITTLNYYGNVIQQQSAPTALTRANALPIIATVIGLTGAYVPEPAKPEGDQPTGLGPRRASYQGILKQTPDFIIVGTEQRQLVASKQFSMAAVSLITVVNGLIVTVNFYAPASDDKNYSELAKVAEAYGNQLLSLNP